MSEEATPTDPAPAGSPQAPETPVQDPAPVVETQPVEPAPAPADDAVQVPPPSEAELAKLAEENDDSTETPPEAPPEVHDLLQDADTARAEAERIEALVNVTVPTVQRPVGAASYEFVKYEPDSALAGPHFIQVRKD